MRLSLLAATCGMALSLLATEAAAQKTRLTVYTALENEQLAPFKQAAEAALKDVEIAWVRDSTGVITARLMAEKSAEPGLQGPDRDAEPELIRHRIPDGRRLDRV